MNTLFVYSEAPSTQGTITSRKQYIVDTPIVIAHMPGFYHVRNVLTNKPIIAYKHNLEVYDPVKHSNLEGAPK
jgi:hypothetical protein